MNSTIYAALNQCSTTGLERLVRSIPYPDGKLVEVYRDHKGLHRVVLFEGVAPMRGVSGLIVLPDGEVYYKETAPQCRGNNYTRILQVVLTLCGIFWYKSENLTTAGAACYK